MSDFVAFRSKSTGVVSYYPAHYKDHPVFGFDLEPYDPNSGEYEEDKVVIETHDLPVDQRAYIVAEPVDDMTVAELKDALSKRELSTSGNKDELLARLAEANKNEDI